MASWRVCGRPARMIAMPCLFLGFAVALEGDGADQTDSSFQAAIDAILDTDAAKLELAGIETSMRPVFGALPRDALGRFPQQAARHIIRRYLASRRAWLVRGLEPSDRGDTSARALHTISILQHKAPALQRALLEMRVAERGVSPQETILLTGAIERLLLNESFATLRLAYEFNNLSVTDQLEWDKLQQVLWSHMLIFNRGVVGGPLDSRTHDVLLAESQSSSEDWPGLVRFVDTVMKDVAGKDNKETATLPTYSFSKATQIVEELAKRYGKWQNAECRAMKQDLRSLDPNRSGRVLLPAFHGQRPTSKFQFTESKAFLRKLGALDEAVPAAPKVIIANYVDGVSNCVAPFQHHSSCCISDCTAIREELETHVQAPTALPEELASTILNLPQSPAATPNHIPAPLLQRLHDIAERHGGRVPLHGRRFTLWLHHAFPYACPDPLAARQQQVSEDFWSDPRAVLVEQEASGRPADAAAGQRRTEPLPAVRAGGDRRSGGRAADGSRLAHVAGVLARLLVLLATLRLMIQFGQAAIGAASWRQSHALGTNEEKEQQPLRCKRPKGETSRAQPTARPRQQTHAGSAKLRKRSKKVEQCAFDDKELRAGTEESESQKSGVTEDLRDNVDSAIGLGKRAPGDPGALSSAEHAEHTGGMESMHASSFMTGESHANEGVVERSSSDHGPQLSHAVECSWRAPCGLAKVFVPFLQSCDDSEDEGEQMISRPSQKAPWCSEHTRAHEVTQALTPSARESPLSDQEEAPASEVCSADALSAVSEPAEAGYDPSSEPLGSLPWRPPPGLEMLRPIGWVAEGLDEASAAPPPARESVSSTAELNERLRILEEALCQERAARKRLEDALFGHGGLGAGGIAWQT
eukprot:CAMPEP_0179207980 /NCGR_PEP_ID=MMETSP0796-20121207/103716_1 /TAXON_ID=73915 /ORGANISM="Pyrodinium bahamense, Strain pbaha01" /LENGTH=869 /DNA_ID=CAMNT_0020912921 /DNA_START=123 /DNA_END=2732 /DNA_ORIENTATION=+